MNVLDETFEIHGNIRLIGDATVLGRVYGSLEVRGAGALLQTGKGSMIGGDINAPYLISRGLIRGRVSARVHGDFALDSAARGAEEGTRADEGEIRLLAIKDREVEAFEDEILSYATGGRMFVESCGRSVAFEDGIVSPASSFVSLWLKKLTGSPK